MSNNGVFNQTQREMWWNDVRNDIDSDVSDAFSDAFRADDPSDPYTCC